MDNPSSYELVCPCHHPLLNSSKSLSAAVSLHLPSAKDFLRLNESRMSSESTLGLYWAPSPILPKGSVMISLPRRQSDDGKVHV
jgi:hypothetical protein